MKYMNQRMKYNLQHFAGKDAAKKGGKGDDNQDEEDDGDEEDDEDEDESSNKKSKKSVKTFTQEELDAAIERRLIRERRKAEKAKKAQEQEEADKKKTPEEKNDDRYLKMESKLEAMQAKMTCMEHGVAKENIEDVVILAKRYVDDETDFEEALETVLKKYPHFVNSEEEDEEEGKSTPKKKQQYKPKKGKKETINNPWKKDSYNLTEQGKLIKEDPEAAKELAAAAGVTLNI